MFDKKDRIDTGPDEQDFEGSSPHQRDASHTVRNLFQRDKFAVCLEALVSKMRERASDSLTRADLGASHKSRAV